MVYNYNETIATPTNINVVYSFKPADCKNIYSVWRVLVSINYIRSVISPPRLHVEIFTLNINYIIIYFNIECQVFRYDFTTILWRRVCFNPCFNFNELN